MPNSHLTVFLVSNFLSHSTALWDSLIVVFTMWHICFRPPFLSGGGGLSSTGATLSSFHLLVELGLMLQLFAAYIRIEPDQLFIKRKHETCSKQTKLFLDPIYTCLEAFLGFLVDTKVKAYTKLTVVMCCPICYKRSLAPSELMFGMLGLVSAKAWPRDLLREVEWWQKACWAGGVHQLKSDVYKLV